MKEVNEVGHKGFEYTAMVALLAKSGFEIQQDLSDESTHLWHMATGVSGEATEIMSALYDDGVEVWEDVDIDNMVEELGDIDFYMEGVYHGVEYIHMLHINAMANANLYWDRTDRLEAARYTAVRLQIAAGSVLDLIKKVAIYNKPLAPLKQQILDYLFDMNIWLTILLEICDSSRYASRQHNMEKLETRYPNYGYSNEHAQARADKQ